MGYVFLFLCMPCNFFFFYPFFLNWAFEKIATFPSLCRPTLCHERASLISTCLSFRVSMGQRIKLLSGFFLSMHLPWASVCTIFKSPIYTAAFKCLNFPKCLTWTPWALDVLLYLPPPTQPLAPGVCESLVTCGFHKKYPQLLSTTSLSEL